MCQEITSYAGITLVHLTPHDFPYISKLMYVGVLDKKLIKKVNKQINNRRQKHKYKAPCTQGIFSVGKKSVENPQQKSSWISAAVIDFVSWISPFNMADPVYRCDLSVVATLSIMKSDIPLFVLHCGFINLPRFPCNKMGHRFHADFSAECMGFTHQNLGEIPPCERGLITLHCLSKVTLH